MTTVVPKTPKGYSLGSVKVKTCIILAVLITFSISSILIANYYGKNTAKIVSDYNHIPLVAGVFVLSLFINKRQKAKSQYGKAWRWFSVFIGMWLAAEITWSAIALTTNNLPFPSLADYFYITGYLFYGLFLMYYVKPFKIVISRKTYAIAFLSSVIVTLTPFMMLNEFSHLPTKGISTDLILGMTYPILDGIIVFPSTLCVITFMRGSISFLMLLFGLNVAFNIIADNVFLYLTQNNAYYDGHPIETLYLCMYSTLLAGTYFVFMKSKTIQNEFGLAEKNSSH